MKSRKKYAMRNITFGMINKVITILLPFATRSVLIYTLGLQYVGLSSLFTSILQVLNLAELGFASAIVFNLYKPIAEKDDDKVRAYLNAYKKIYKIVGLIVLVFGLCITPFIKFLIKDSGQIDINLYVLFIIYVLNSSLSYLFFAYKGSIFSATQRNDISYNLRSIATIIHSTLAIIVLVVLKNYYIFALTILFGTIVNNLLIYIIFQKKYSKYSPKGDITVEEKKALKQNVFDLFGGKLSGIFFNTFDSVIISSVLGSFVLGVYSNYYTIMSSVYGVTIIFSSGLLASIGNKIATSSVDENYAVFKRIEFFFKWLVAWFAICLVCLYPPFMKIWLNDDNRLLSFNFVILFASYFYLYTIRNVVCIYKEAAGLWHSDRLRPYLEAASNIVGNIVLIQLMGLQGILVSTIITLSIIGNPWLTSSLFKDYFKRSQKEYYFKLIYNIVIMILAGFATYFICSLLPAFGVWSFVGKLAICAILPNILFVLFYFKSPEFGYYIGLMKDLFKDRKHFSLSKIFSNKKK